MAGGEIMVPPTQIKIHLKHKHIDLNLNYNHGLVIVFF